MESKSCVLHANAVKRRFFQSMEVLENGPVESGVSDIPGSDPWIFQSSSFLADDSHDGFSMMIDSDIWSSRSGCCYLSRVSAVSRKPNVHFKRHRESLMLIFNVEHIVDDDCIEHISFLMSSLLNSM